MEGRVRGPWYARSAPQSVGLSLWAGQRQHGKARQTLHQPGDDTLRRLRWQHF